jgi:hypothetical protein
MSKRMTSKQLNARLLAIDNVIAMLQGGLNTLEAAGAYEAMNPIHNVIWDMQNAKHDLETEFSTQDWTTADWQSWSLVCDNID